MPITFAEAALGAEIDVPTLEGEEKFRIPEGTQTGTSFTMKGKGIKYINSQRKGDLIFNVVLETPKNLSDKQRQLLREFADSCVTSNHQRVSSFLKRIFKDKK